MAVDVRSRGASKKFLSESQWTTPIATGTLHRQETLSCRALTHRPGARQLAIVEIPGDSPWSGASAADVRLALGLDESWELLTLRALPKWLPGVVDDLNELATLEPNWDSYGGDVVSSSTRRRAAEVLLRLIPANAREPSVVPLSDGGVQFEWHGDSAIEIQVGSEGDPEVWFRDATGHSEELTLANDEAYARTIAVIRSAS
jgi:hypothetical protein